MSRSRIVFIAIIGAAVLVVVAATLLQNAQKNNDNAQAALVAQMTQTAVGIPGNNNVPVVPLFAGGQVPTDNLPTYTCAADAFASYYPLEQMQQAGLDVKYGFHLGLIPIALPSTDGRYDLSEAARDDLLNNGKIDCLFTTLDATALKGSGQITAVIDESAGADQLWARPSVKQLNDLRGKKIIYVTDSVGQFMVLYALNVAGLTTDQVTLIGADTVQDAVKRFNAGEADVVSGYEPDILKAKDTGQVLLSTDKLHVIVDVIMTSRQAIKGKANVVQAFHNAWFATLKAQFEDFPGAAKQIAAWGNNDWSGITVANAQKDLSDQIQKIAQAGLTQNNDVMNNTSRLIDRLTTAGQVWSAGGLSAYTGNMSDLVDPDFVKGSSKLTELGTSKSAPNSNFVLASHPDVAAIAPDQGDTLAVLPCRKFDFGPDNPTINTNAAQTLDKCVVPILESSTGIYLKITGSAAWPAATPPWQEKDITDIALKRAQAVAAYLQKKGIDPSRLTVTSILPPVTDRNTDNTDIQAQDRFVQMDLVTVGR